MIRERTASIYNVPDWQARGDMSKFIIVDDDPFSLELVKAAFEEAGHQAQCFQDPRQLAEAVDTVEADGFVLDVVMPEMSGWELLSLLRGHPRTKTAPIIILTSLAEPPYRVRALREGADDCVNKPFDAEELVARMDVVQSYRIKPNADLQGSLEANPLHHVLQYLAVERKAGTLEVFAGDESGRFRIYPEGSAIASFRNLLGADACEAMLELNHGSFRFRSENAESKADAAAIDINQMLFKSAWVADELSARIEALPDPEAPVAIVGKSARFPSKFSFLPLAEIAQYLRDNLGTSLNELIGIGLASPARTRLSVALLVERGVAK